jgi:hypothetical protein
MAETLTFEDTTETTTIENLNAEEQDSLKVGEQMEQEQEQLLAGKYKDAQELEQAYVKLQKKLGEKGSKDDEPVDEAEVQESEEVQEEKKETEEAPDGILDTLWEESVSGEKFSDETLAELSKLTTGQLAGQFLKWRSTAESKLANKQRDFTAADVETLKGVVGGEKEYNSMLQWAQQNLNPREVEMFDQVMERGDPLAAFFAVRSLAYRYQDKSGFDGKMVTGSAPKSSKGDVFKSQAEVVRAMGDSRYEDDPAYRQSIMDKLERSDINF